MKVLAVDDDRFILELLIMMLAKVGFTDISTVSSGEAALDLLNDSENVFDCLLLDISMPGMDGIELCGLARALPAYKKTPIIMLTAMAEKSYVDRAFLAGATDYANKPFDMVELHARLRLAEELVSARKMTADERAKADEVQSDDARRHAFDLADEIKLEGVRNLIDYQALRNYLTQLSNTGLASSQLLAVKIDSVERICAKATSEEFIYALMETADAISSVLGLHGCVMAYAGNGTFVVVLSKANLELSVDFQAEIQNLLDERESEYDNGDPLDLEVSVGNPLRPSPSEGTRTRIRKTFDRAIARAESRSFGKDSETRTPDIRLIRG